METADNEAKMNLRVCLFCAHCLDDRRQGACHSPVAPAAPWYHRRSTCSYCGGNGDKSDFRRAPTCGGPASGRANLRFVQQRLDVQFGKSGCSAAKEASFV